MKTKDIVRLDELWPFGNKQDKAAAAEQKKGQDWLYKLISQTYSAWNQRLGTNRYTPDATGFNKFKTEFLTPLKNWPPDPESFDNQSIYKYIEAYHKQLAAEESTASQTTQPPQTSQTAQTIQNVIKAIRSLSVEEAGELIDELRADGYKI
jgi:hypothetical protein